MIDKEFAAETRQYLAKMLHHAFDEGASIDQVKIDMLKAAANANMTPEDWASVVATTWNELVDKALDDHVLSEDEENRLAGIRSAFSLVNIRACNRGLNRLVQAATLRDLANGHLSKRFSCDVPIPFKLKTDEALLWMFQRVKLLETKVRRSMVGGSTGLSVRIARGVYGRVGAFKATPVVSEEMAEVDRGLLFVTNKQIAFSGGSKNFRMAFDSLAVIKPYSDGLELQKGTSTAKPFFLTNLDGWFVYNVMQFA